MKEEKIIELEKRLKVVEDYINEQIKAHQEEMDRRADEMFKRIMDNSVYGG